MTLNTLHRPGQAHSCCSNWQHKPINSLENLLKPKVVSKENRLQHVSSEWTWRPPDVFSRICTVKRHIHSGCKYMIKKKLSSLYTGTKVWNSGSAGKLCCHVSNQLYIHETLRCYSRRSGAEQDLSQNFKTLCIIKTRREFTGIWTYSPYNITLKNHR